MSENDVLEHGCTLTSPGPARYLSRWLYLFISPLTMNIAFFLYGLGVFSKVTERNGKSEVERSSNHGFTLQTTKMPGSGPSQESSSSSRSPEHLGRHGLLLQVHEEGAGLIGTGSSRTPSSTYVGCQNYGEQRKALGHSSCDLTRHSAIKPYLIWFVDFASVWLDDWLEMLTKERRGTVKWVVIFLVPSSITDLSHFLLPSVPSSLQIIQELPEGNFAFETSLSSAFLLFISVRSVLGI